MKHIYRITMYDRNPRTGQRNFINFQCEAPDVEALRQAVKDDREIHGDMLFTKLVEQGTWAITGRRRLRLDKARIMSISVPMWRFVRETVAA